ncbi:SDR family NAD(P)-dependent oxidoreductase [Microbacterium rhizosphaerae]|uniref:SDR family oxidoreductase n=1 Tax=Microbacterium rhizosphaerae TaxID=1678237 RepID=A0ABZ0SRY9_9MICO|nr:SDR family oxidoreductase [Microbacterium rhizosphaerae]WPR90106.1 SDR family oxidoreductase [Microbacterium rhizosphaerae]
MIDDTTSSPRTVLVTGAAGGLGRAFAEAFARRGDVVVIADIDRVGAERAAAELAAEGLTVTGAGVDVTDASSTAELAALTAEAGRGGIDVVINNAAIYATLTRSPFEDIDETEWDRVMAVNLKGPWLVARASSPLLNTGARIVNISSATVMSGSAQWAHYVASKAGVIGLTRVLAKELGARGITVNAVAPGFTLTEASHSLMPDAESYGIDRGSIKRPIQPDDIVGAVLFLASPESAFVTGQTLVVDGGRQFL